MCIKHDYTMSLVETENISMMKALSDYVIVHSDEKKYVTLSTMWEMEERTPHEFVRSHRSYIVNLDRVKHVKGDRIVLDDGRVAKIGRAFKKEFKQKLTDKIN